MNEKIDPKLTIEGKRIERKKEEESWRDLNEAMCYGVTPDGKTAHIHLSIGIRGIRKMGLSNFENSFVEGLGLLAEEVEKNKQIEQVTMTSTLVSRRHAFLNKLGFKDISVVSDELHQRHFDEYNQEDVHTARMGREEYIEKFGKKNE